MSAIKSQVQGLFLDRPGPTSALRPSERTHLAKPHRATFDPRILVTAFDSYKHDVDGSPAPPTHPAIVAYRQAHPRRALIYFGPYILLQTLGEGEFGKVKLGIHKDSYEEVAVKLIRRTNLNGEARHAKVEREINVLRVSLESSTSSVQPDGMIICFHRPFSTRT
jgi:serine/threonine protein kinase